ncbi:MAG TPA: S24 family peptidase, partial [Lamprocystis sp. (in: g-proteobacteria)]|nr:S24 family peptidase [Lamprocystis sp. (in: g-proteobacteria)]
MTEPNPDSTPNRADCSRSEPYVLQVLGDEMAPEFPPGCIVVIAPADTCRDGSYVFVEVEGVRWFRRYVRDEGGPGRLVAENPSYPDIDLAGLHWSTLGVIIQRNIRRQIKHYVD